VVRRSHLVRLAALAAAVWVLRWAVLELASYLHRTRPRPPPLPRDSEHVPGAMPTPFDV
jgi:hypothetical protein